MEICTKRFYGIWEIDFGCAATLQNGISSLRVLFTLSSLHYWKEMAFSSKESHQPLAAKKSNEIWIVETLVGGQEKCQTIIKRERKGETLSGARK